MEPDAAVHHRLTLKTKRQLPKSSATCLLMFSNCRNLESRQRFDVRKSIVQEKKEDPVKMSIAERPADQSRSISAKLCPSSQTEMTGIHPVQDGSPAIDVLIDVIVADLLMDERV